MRLKNVTEMVNAFIIPPLEKNQCINSGDVKRIGEFSNVPNDLVTKDNQNAMQLVMLHVYIQNNDFF